MPQAEGEPSRMAHYPTPGTAYLGNLSPGPLRGLHWASNGALFAVSGPNVFTINANPYPWQGTWLGSITPGLTTPVSMADNGLDLIIVDGSNNGWDINLASNAFTQISDPTGMFSGADKVCYSDTYFIFNKPATPQFYISGSLAVTFDPLDFANKEAFSDSLVTIAVARRELYLFGEQTTEVWFNAGASGATDTSAFAYNMVQGVFIDHGCAAKYSVSTYDNAIYWLSRNRAGHAIVMETAGYRVNRISTYAIETALAPYNTVVSDAVGFCYQMNGHAYYVLTFPTANKTWVYDITTQLWHEWAFIDSNGTEHRHRASCYAMVDTNPVVGDYQTGSIYLLDSNTYTDCIDQVNYPIKRERSYPHLLLNGRRVMYREFVADMETGVAPKQGPVPDNLLVSLDWSDDRGHSYGSPLVQGIGGTSPVLGAGGDYLTSLQWQRLGMARDRVFRVSWTVAAPTSLQGAWVRAEPADQDEMTAEAAD